MGKRGPKPKKIINTKWRPSLAYAIGLIATDGCLGQNGLWVDLTSKDKEQLANFSKCLGVNFKITDKWSGSKDKTYRIQFKNKIFYEFLFSVGLTPRKSLTLNKLKIPKKYFFDFLRGCFDGDGCSYSYWDKRWRSSFMFYVCFASASKNFLDWIRSEIHKIIKIKGHITQAKKKNYYFQLKYAKKESLEIINKMYYNPKVVCLSRKLKKIEQTLKIDTKQQKKYARVV